MAVVLLRMVTWIPFQFVFLSDSIQVRDLYLSLYLSSRFVGLVFLFPSQESLRTSVSFYLSLCAVVRSTVLLPNDDRESVILGFLIFTMHQGGVISLSIIPSFPTMHHVASLVTSNATIT